MGIFSSILSKLGFGDHQPDTASSIATQPEDTAGDTTQAPDAQTPAPMAPVAISQIDVAAQLEGLAAASAEKLNWKVSIVDLMKLLGLESSLAARKELATELGCPTDKMSDSAAMNIWLHKTVMQKLADNGGKVPPELLG
jgi:hypothetical protein